MTSDEAGIGMIEIRSSMKDMLIHCKDGGAKNWYGGNLITISTTNWGICSSGTTNTLIIERTSVALKILRSGGVVFSRNWATTDGKCLLEAGLWRLQNYGTTVLTAESVLGTARFILWNDLT